jgi:hypothetical protein
MYIFLASLLVSSIGFASDISPDEKPLTSSPASRSGSNSGNASHSETPQAKSLEPLPHSLHGLETIYINGKPVGAHFLGETLHHFDGPPWWGHPNTTLDNHWGRVSEKS